MHNNYFTRYQTNIQAPIEKVWDALTNPHMVRQYFFGSELQTDWQVGNPIYFRGEFEGMPYEDKGTVLEFIPHQKLSFSYLSTWANLEDEPENYLSITYEVKPLGKQTSLSIVQSNYDEEKAKHSAENWKIVMEGLKKMIE